MSTLLNNIVNYIKMVYKPDAISVDENILDNGRKEHIIHLLFNNIDDSYITNPYGSDLIANKEKNLEREIRRDILNYFSTETSGFDLNGFAPYKKRSLTIYVLGGRVN